jgi:N-acyl-L-homoserine lactone synthetase
MLRPASSEAIAAAGDELRIEIATTPEQILEAQQLRYRVYCEERGFLPGANGLEQDRFDGHSRHVLVRSLVTGMTLGTVRIVLPTAEAGFASVPMAGVCEDYVLAPLPVSSTGEVSRFALTRDRTGISPAVAALMRLCLFRGLVQLSAQAGLTHWCAIMEKTLLRLLRTTSIHFQPVGPEVEFHGLRQPVVAAIDSILSRIQREQPAVWGYLTDHGSLWSEAPHQTEEAA